MANFNLADYETVEERIKRFYADHPDGRIITENLTTQQDRAVSTWVVKSEIWLPVWTLTKDAHDWFVNDRDSSPFYLKATGLAFEIDGGGGANKTSALENAETSSIGRALSNAGYSGNKRASREEMEKVERDKTPAVDWLAMASGRNVDGLRELYSQAVAGRASKTILDQLKELGVNKTAKSESEGTW